jgi:tetratricopeptide (TPR) repeat protein
MGSDQDILSRLPQAPAPLPEAREAAIAAALQRFDEHAQGTVRSPTRHGMPRVRQLLAASVVVGIAAPVAWHYLGSARQPEQFQMASGVVHPAEPARPKVIADRLESEVLAKRTAEAEPRSPAGLAYAPQLQSVVPPPVPAQPRARDQAGAEPRAVPPSPDWEACTAPEPDRRITGCTRIAHDQSQNRQLRAVAYLNRGAAHAQQGQLDRAIADYSEAIGLDPNYAVAFYNRSLVYLTKGETDRASADRDRAISIDPAYQSR